MQTSKIPAVSYKAKLLQFVHDGDFPAEEKQEETKEILSYSEERCKEEFLKIQNFISFMEELKPFIENGGDISNLDSMPLIAQQQKEQDFLIKENSNKQALKKRSKFQLV